MHERRRGKASVIFDDASSPRDLDRLLPEGAGHDAVAQGLATAKVYAFGSVPASRRPIRTAHRGLATAVMTSSSARSSTASRTPPGVDDAAAATPGSRRPGYRPTVRRTGVRRQPRGDRRRLQRRDQRPQHESPVCRAFGLPSRVPAVPSGDHTRVRVLLSTPRAQQVADQPTGPPPVHHLRDHDRPGRSRPAREERRALDNAASTAAAVTASIRRNTPTTPFRSAPPGWS